MESLPDSRSVTHVGKSIMSPMSIVPLSFRLVSLVNISIMYIGCLI